MSLDELIQEGMDEMNSRHPFDKDLSNRLTILLAESNLSLTDLSTQLKMDRAHLKKMFYGSKYVTKADYQVLLRSLDKAALVRKAGRTTQFVESTKNR
ncbi:hypothetical protein [Schleiferilactobacillus shenzhenensis]|nr:hypothetical protein [Schleiferilactobacillus shenzhenensis]